MAPSASQQRLALAILDFLHTSTTDGTIPADEAESLEIASSCISETFKVDLSDKSALSDALGGQNLLGIYGVYEKLKGSKATKSAAGDGGSAAAGATNTGDKSVPAGGAEPAARTEANALKSQGNTAMAQKDYASAIDLYTRALALIPLDPIFLSNRAAAYSGNQQHSEAKEDAEMAVAADPGYTKAWSRLGLARYALGDSRGSMEAYAKGIEAEGNGGSDAMKKGYETAKRKVEEEEGKGSAGSPAETARSASGPGAGGMPDLASLAGMLGGGGGGGAGGPGGFDFSQLMNNPMMKQMAENVMKNPEMMNSVMNNPRLRELASQFGGGGAGGAGRGTDGGSGGGGMPDLASLMNDPSMAEMARNLMGGGGAGGAGGAGRGSG